MMKSVSLSDFLLPFSRCCVILHDLHFSSDLDYTAIIQFGLIQLIFSSREVREHFNAMPDVPQI